MEKVLPIRVFKSTPRVSTFRRNTEGCFSQIPRSPHSVSNTSLEKKVTCPLYPGLYLKNRSPTSPLPATQVTSGTETI